MNIHVDVQKENKLMDRREFEVRIEYKGATPPKKQIREALANDIRSDPSLVAIRRITNEYGKSELKVKAHVYADRATYEKYEPYHILVRYGEKEKKAKKVKAKAAPKKRKEA